MEPTSSLRIRVVACPESRDDGKEWSFYLINDTVEPIRRAVLDTFELEWGDTSVVLHPGSEVYDISSGDYALLWRDNDEELHMQLYFRVQVGNVEERMFIKFPLLYKRLPELAVVDALGKKGWVEAAVRQP